MSASLLEKQSTGGSIARVGFEYKDAIVLRSLPLWLSQSAFSHIVSEALSDIEVCYFSSEKSLHVMYEAKNQMTRTTFQRWKLVTLLNKANGNSRLEYDFFNAMVYYIDRM